MNALKPLLSSFLMVLMGSFAAWSVLDVAVPAAVDRELAAQAATVERHNERIWPHAAVHWARPDLPDATAAWLLVLLLGILSVASSRCRLHPVAATHSALVSAVVGLGALAFAKPLTIGIHLMWFSSWFAF